MRCHAPGRYPLWSEGLLAAALWLAGGMFTLAWRMSDDAGPIARVGDEPVCHRRWTAGAGAELPLLVSAGRSFARGWQVAGAAAVAVCVMGVADGKTAILPVPFCPPQALIEVLVDDWPRLLDSLLHSLGLLGLGCCSGPPAVYQRAGDWLVAAYRLLAASGPASAWPGALNGALAAMPVYFSLQLWGKRVSDCAEHLVSGHRADLVRGHEYR